MHSKLGEPNLVELIGMFAEAPIGFCCFDRNLQFTLINNCLGVVTLSDLETLRSATCFMRRQPPHTIH